MEIKNSIKYYIGGVAIYLASIALITMGGSSERSETPLPAMYSSQQILVPLTQSIFLREDTIYAVMPCAQLKSIDIQVAQTRYSFLRDGVEYQFDFVSPSLSQRTETAGCPVGFMTYYVSPKDNRKHDTNIHFELDIEQPTREMNVKDSMQQGWRIIQIGNFYIAAPRQEMEWIYNDGRISISPRRQGSNEVNQGVIVFGYEEERLLQYYGENLLPYWKKKKDMRMEDALISIGNNYEIWKEECGKANMHFVQKAQQNHHKMEAEQLISLYRNFAATHKWATMPDNEMICFGDTIGKIKEVAESLPYLLFFERTDWIKGMLKPVFECTEHKPWTKKFPPYDIGVFPIAIRQESVEDHGAEMAADMLMIMAKMVEFENNFDYARKHWQVLRVWAEYLTEITEKKKIPSDCLLDGRDEQVMAVFGLKAYNKLLELQKKYE